MIPPLVPALSYAGFCRYSSMPLTDVKLVEDKQPGFVVTTARVVQRRLYAQLRKRYLVDALGQDVGSPSPLGTAPPTINFTGTPTWGDLLIRIEIMAPGGTGASTFRWSKDGGQTWIDDVLTASTVYLPGTGLTVLFPAAPAAFFSDNVYVASTPIPEEFLQWVTDITTPRVYERRGVNPTNDAAMAKMEERSKTALAEVAEASNSQTGLFDLALNADAGGSGISQGGPLGYTETSPYVWQDQQACQGRNEDCQGSGTGDC